MKTAYDYMSALTADERTPSVKALEFGWLTSFYWTPRMRLMTSARRLRRPVSKATKLVTMRAKKLPSRSLHDRYSL